MSRVWVAARAALATSPLNSPGVVAGVIEEARARQWRRWKVILAATASVALAVALLADHDLNPPARPKAQPPPVAAVALTAVLAQQPYLGLACPAPVPFNAARAIAVARACNRVGLSIEVRTRAVGAIATINGYTFALDAPAWSDPPVKGKHKFLAGFLGPAPFLNTGPFTALRAGMGGNGWQAPITHLHLVIDYGGGHEVQTSTIVIGFGGWG